MSSILAFAGGLFQTSTPKVLTASATAYDILSPTGNLGGSGYLVNFVNFAVGTVSAVTLVMFDGTTSYFLINAKSLAANDTFIYEFPFLLPQNWVLRALASTAGQVTVTASYVAYPKASGPR